MKRAKMVLSVLMLVMACLTWAGCAQRSRGHPGAVPGETAGNLARPAESTERTGEISGNTVPADIATQEEPAAEYAGMLRITEIMPKNRACLPDADGIFRDWVEIENIGEEAVSLYGWSVSDKPKKRRQAVSQELLQPGERLIVFCRDFGISEEETLYLIDPNGEAQDAVLCPSLREGSAYALQPDGSFRETVWATPGFSNDTAGYEAFCDADTRQGALRFSEVMVSNEAHPDELGRMNDWVELVNVSAETRNLAGYVLSRDPTPEEAELQSPHAAESTPSYWTFPAAALAPGECMVVCCDGGGPGSQENTGFSLDAVTDTLYLLNPDGEVEDYIFLHEIPIEGSMGRCSGQNGYFYFTEPTPGSENAAGERRVSAMPVSMTPEGAHEHVDRLNVELDAPGAEIYYTVDGTVPTKASSRYTGVLELTETAVVRAIAVERGACPSRTATFAYFLNEGHTLPLLSLTVDDQAQFQNIYSLGIKERSVPAHLALYDGEMVFSRDCELSMKGWTSLSMPKKSMGVRFKGRYGGALDCDVFENGITEYEELALRVGQDYTFSVFRNELVQELCREASRNLYTQEGKYCILYVNGEYYGIYCLKEDVTRSFYASHAGVSRESVEGFRAPAALNSDYYNLLVDYGWHSDLTQEENYRVLCEGINIDSLIDWFLFEAWCGNTDTQGNLRVYRSMENGYRWEYVLYDLDWAFHYWQGGFRTILDGIGNAGSEMPNMLNNLLKNQDFRDRLLRRYSELIHTTLSDEYVLSKIDSYVELLSPEISRDHARWGQTYEDWESRVGLLRDTITKNNYAQYTVNDLCRRLGLTEEEKVRYFGMPDMDDKDRNRWADTFIGTMTKTQGGP